MAPIAAARTRRATGGVRSPLRTPSANRATATALLSVMLLSLARLLRQRAAAANPSRRTAQWVAHCCAAQLSDSLRYCFAYTTRVLCRRPTRCCGRSRFTGRKARPGGARQPSLMVAFVRCILHAVRCVCGACCILRQRVVSSGSLRGAPLCAAPCRAAHPIPSIRIDSAYPPRLLRCVHRPTVYSCALTAHSNGSRPKRAVS